MSSARAGFPRIDWVQRPPRFLACPVCSARGQKPFVLAAHPTWHDGAQLELFACPACGSKFFPDLEQPEYRDFGEIDAYLQFYLEIGAGVDQLVRNLFVVPPKRGGQYLDVGCGFGFALDFARRQLGMQVLGIDPSPFAAAGARLLDIPIIADYLTPEMDLDGRKFDVAVASEVIEHFSSPHLFIRSIADRLAPNGVIILTTPNGASVVPETPRGVLTPLLSPGWHHILYSESGLKRVFQSAGFRHVEVAARRHTLALAATNGALPMDLHAPFERDQLVTYFEARRKATGGSRPLRNGMDYRLLKELVNTGRYERALAVYDDLRRRFLAEYRFDMDAEDHGWLHRNSQESFITFARYPMCLCGVTYFRGVLALNHERSYARAAHYFSLSTLHGATLREMLQDIGADDAETEVFVEQGRVLGARALAYVCPAQAAAQAVRLLRESMTPSAPPAAGQEPAVGIFAHLVNLGAYDAAEEMAAEAELALRDRRGQNNTGASNLHFEINHAFAALELNHRRRPRRAALRFALAERAAKRAGSGQAAGGGRGREWQARRGRLLAWVVGGDARRALLVGRLFQHPRHSDSIPAEIAASARQLINQVLRSIGSKPP